MPYRNISNDIDTKVLKNKLLTRIDMYTEILVTMTKNI